MNTPLLPSDEKLDHSTKQNVLHQLRAVLLDILVFCIFLTLLPLILCICALVCCVPIVDYLLHPKRQYLDGVSAAFISNLPEAIIHGFLVSERPVKGDVFMKNFEKVYFKAGTPEFKKLQQRIVQSKICWPYWQDVSDSFDLKNHQHIITEQVTKIDMEDRLSKFQNKLMPTELPPWDLYHFENFIDEDGRNCSATLLRVHHSMCDGFVYLRWLMAGADPRKPPEADNLNNKQTAPARNTRPGVIAMFFALLAAIRKLVCMVNDAPSSYKSAKHIQPSGPRYISWSRLRCASVDNLKELGRKLGGATVNDLLLSALAGALRRHQLTAYSPIGGDITACMWAALRPMTEVYADFKDKPLVWGNSTLGAVYLKVPVGRQYDSFTATHTLGHMRKITSDPALRTEAATATAFTSLFGCLPAWASAPLWKALANKVSISMSNVPGPQFNFDWCGIPTNYVIFFVPPTGTISVFVTIFTCRGQVHVGMGSDGALFESDGLRKITSEYFESEILELLEQAKQKPKENLKH